MAKRNYRDEIDAAVERGDYVTAGYLETERNKKIDNEKLPYEKTNDYASYLNRDYGNDIIEGIRSGNAGAVRTATKYRDEKATLPGYTQYADDAIANKGKAYTELNTILNTPFTYNNGKAQLDARQKEINTMINNIRNYKDFEYNRDADPRYAELAKMYTRNGQRAMSDTIGEISARTGGLASSYAATAGNQAYANYMSELGDKALDLEKLAYQMYDDKYNRDLQALSLAQNRYESDLARFNNDRNFEYNKYGDVRNMAYNRMREMTDNEIRNEENAYNRAWNEDEREYNRGFAKMQWDYGVADDEYNKNLAKAQTLGQVGNFDAYKDLGYSDDEINSLKKAYADARTLEIMKATKSSGGSSSNTKGGAGDTTNLLDTMLAFGDDSKAEAYLYSLNKYDEDERDKLWELYKGMKSGSSVFENADGEPVTNVDEASRSRALADIDNAANTVEMANNPQKLLEVIYEWYSKGALTDDDMINLINWHSLGGAR